MKQVFIDYQFIGRDFCDSLSTTADCSSRSRKFSVSSSLILRQDTWVGFIGGTVVHNIPGILYQPPGTPCTRYQVYHVPLYQVHHVPGILHHVQGTPCTRYTMYLKDNHPLKEFLFINPSAERETDQDCKHLRQVSVKIYKKNMYFLSKIKEQRWRRGLLPA